MPHGSYSYPLVIVSIVLAMCSSYATQDLAVRVAAADCRKRWTWLLGGYCRGLWQLFCLLKPSAPDLKAIFISRYAAAMLGRHNPLPPEAAFIEKPFGKD